MVAAARLLAAAALCAAASSGSAEQLGSRQTLECRGAHCVPDRILGDPSVPSIHLAYAPRHRTYAHARAARSKRHRMVCQPVGLEGVGPVWICSPPRAR